MTLRIAVDIEAVGEVFTAVATTLGAGGLFVATEEPLDEGTSLVARFHLLPGSARHELRGRVVWNHFKDELPAQASGMGIAFEDPASGAVLAAELEALAPAD